MFATEQNLGWLMEDTREVIHDLEGLLRGIPHDLGEEARQARAKLETTIEGAKQRCRELERRALAGAQSADALIHHRPYPVAGTAFLIGLVVGALLGRRP